MRDETHPSKLGKSRTEKSNKQLDTLEPSAHGTGVARGTPGPFPLVKVLEDGNSIRPVDQASLKKAFGTTDDYFVKGMVLQLAKAGPAERIDEDLLNFMLSIIKGIEPRDQVEGMLAAQMAVIHRNTMMFAERLAHADDILLQDHAQRAVSKLSRAFTSLLEALIRYRTGGRQNVTVGSLSVNDGGQAIVGNVTQVAPGNASAQTTAARRGLSDAEQSPMTIVSEGVREPAPIQRDDKDDACP
jgi:hypothetical protein